MTVDTMIMVILCTYLQQYELILLQPILLQPGVDLVWDVILGVCPPCYRIKSARHADRRLHTITYRHRPQQ